MLSERFPPRCDTHPEAAPKTGTEPPGPEGLRARIPGRSRQLSKTHKQARRSAFDRVVLLLQGGGALGAYQAGVYHALAEAHLHPDWVAGISIGAINSAIIAGNPPNLRVEKLREFWEGITNSWLDVGAGELGLLLARGDSVRGSINQTSAAAVLMSGARGFFRPRIPSPWIHPFGTVEATSYYDTAELKATLESLIDFDRVNAEHAQTRLSLGAVNVRSGNLVYFDSAEPGHQAGARDGEWRVAARLSGDRDRRRALLGWWARLEYTASVDRDDAGAATGLARFPGRSLERAGRGSHATSPRLRPAKRKSSTPAEPGPSPITSSMWQSCETCSRRSLKNCRRK